jgi:hypothetical protein
MWSVVNPCFYRYESEKGFCTSRPSDGNPDTKVLEASRDRKRECNWELDLCDQIFIPCHDYRLWIIMQSWVRVESLGPGCLSANPDHSIYHMALYNELAPSKPQLLYLCYWYKST